jgi:hypothetical protein
VALCRISATSVCKKIVAKLVVSLGLLNFLSYKSNARDTTNFTTKPLQTDVTS